MSKQLTIRNVPDDVAERLKELSRERGQSMNAMIVTMLEQMTGVHQRRVRLERYITWCDKDLDDFGDALARQRVIDDELWH